MAPIILLASIEILTTSLVLQHGQSFDIRSTTHFSQNKLLQFKHSIALLASSRQTGHVKKSVGDCILLLIILLYLK